MESKLRCCIIYKEDYPWDVRVQKVADTLVADGHKVVILCRNLDQLPRRAQMDGYEIQRLPAAKRWPRFVRTAINVPLWLNPFWIFASYRAARTMPADAIIVRDLPLTFTAILIGRLRRARVIFDMAECYPEMYASSLRFSSAGYTGLLLRRFTKNPLLARLYEYVAVRLANHTLVMIEESRDRLLATGASPQRISIVSNTPRLTSERPGPVDHRGRDLRIVYVGFLTRLRGLDILLHALRDHLDTVRDGNVCVDIVGRGAARPELAAIVRDLHLADNAKIHGWLSHDEVQQLVQRANVGALTYRVCGHWNHTIPNKLFDYMLAGLPVIATEVSSIARIVRETDCGVVCRGQDTADIAQHLTALKEPGYRTRLGNNGREAIYRKYNWLAEIPRLRSALHPGR